MVAHYRFHHAVDTIRMAHKGAAFHEEVEAHHVRTTVGTAGTGTHGADDARHEGHMVVHGAAFSDLSLIPKHFEHVQTQDIGLAHLQRAVLLQQGFAYGAFARDGVLDARSMRHFVEHDLGKEGMEIDELGWVRRNKHSSDRHQDRVELGPHGVLEL